MGDVHYLTHPEPRLTVWEAGPSLTPTETAVNRLLGRMSEAFVLLEVAATGAANPRMPIARASRERQADLADAELRACLDALAALRNSPEPDAA